MQKLLLSAISFSFILLCVYGTPGIGFKAQQPSVHTIQKYMAFLRERQRLKTLMESSKNFNPVLDESDGVCEACIQFFESLKEVIEDFSNLTKDTLTEALNITCNHLEGRVPFMDEVCEVFGPDVIEFLYFYFTEVANSIKPEHDCKLLLLCWDHNKSASHQVKKISLDNIPK